MAESFTNKEMLIRVMDKMDTLESKVDKLNEIVRTTNGKVKLHTKFIFFLFGAFLSLAGLVIKILIT